MLMMFARMLILRENRSLLMQQYLATLTKNGTARSIIQIYAINNV